MAHRANSKAPLPKETCPDAMRSHPHFLSTPTIFFSQGIAHHELLLEMIFMDRSPRVVCFALKTTIKEKQALTLPLFPATQRRLSAWPLSLELLLSISTHFRGWGVITHFPCLLQIKIWQRRKYRILIRNRVYLNKHL